MAICARQSALAGRAFTIADMNVSADSYRSKDSVDSNGRGALERASAMIRSFRATCMILKLYLIMSKQNRKMHGGKLSRFLAHIYSSESSGLWSISRMNDFPSKYIENLSQAHVRAKAFFSICA